MGSCERSHLRARAPTCFADAERSNLSARVQSPDRNRRPIVYLVREVMYCKPGKVRALVEKFTAMSALSEKVGMPRMRILTDFAAERYWTLVAEMEVETISEFERMMSSMPGNEDDAKEFEKIMKGYHDLVEYGKREIYKIEMA
jgi:hypothetical protein